MQIIKDKKTLKNICRQITQSKEKIGFVPTMGMLHSAHLSLIDEALGHSQTVIVSIFVNPKQFNNAQDFAKYPKNTETDIKMLEEKGVGYLYLPEITDVYNDDFAFDITIKNLADKLCGEARPGHMNGVCVILLKLFNIIRPDYVFMGEKDYQQLLITQKLAEDFDLDSKIIGCPTIREDSGLAMSSRNERLSESARELIAPKIYQQLTKLKEQIIKNDYIFTIDSINQVKANLLNEGFSQIDYLEILNNDLTKYDAKKRSGRIFIAAWLDDVRLIDNIALYQTKNLLSHL